LLSLSLIPGDFLITLDLGFDFFLDALLLFPSGIKENFVRQHEPTVAWFRFPSGVAL
jgi:hypothetical protein